MLKTNLDYVNYRAKIVKLEGLKKHPQADKLQLVDINYNTVITGLDAKDGDIYVYFPISNQNRFILCQNMVLVALLVMDASKILAAK